MQCTKNMLPDKNCECKVCRHHITNVSHAPLQPIVCPKFQVDGRCVDECPSMSYADRSNVCHACSPQCREGCTGLFRITLSVLR